MTIELPIWAQENDYAARLDRTLIDELWPEELVISGLNVSQRAAGANLSVDVAVGVAVIEGDDQAFQGKYLVRSTAVENLAMPAAPATPGDSRYDIVALAVNDSNAGSAGTPADAAELIVVQGTPTAGTPTLPALPDTAISLARVLRTNGDASVLDSMIADLRPTGPGSQTIVVSTDPPSGGRNGDVWLRV